METHSQPRAMPARMSLDPAGFRDQCQASRREVSHSRAARRPNCGGGWRRHSCATAHAARTLGASAGGRRRRPRRCRETRRRPPPSSRRLKNLSDANGGARLRSAPLTSRTTEWKSYGPNSSLEPNASSERTPTHERNSSFEPKWSGEDVGRWSGTSVMSGGHDPGDPLASQKRASWPPPRPPSLAA